MRLIAAQDVNDVFGAIKPPAELGRYSSMNADRGISGILSQLISLLFLVAAITFVFMFLWSAIQMIISGGDKESLAKARARLTWSIIGIILMAFSFVIFRILERLTGFQFFGY